MFIFSDIDNLASSLVKKGLRFSTHRTYSSAQRFYIAFCQLYKLPVVPASEGTILRFIAYAYSKSLSPNTIQVYLSGVTSLHTLNGWPAPPTNSYRSKLAIKAIQDIGPTPVRSNPITYQLLCYIIQAMPDGPDQLLYRTMLLLGFYGALRGVEYCAVSVDGTIVAPYWYQLQFVHSGTNLGMVYTIPKTKTTSQPVKVAIGCAQVPQCAVCTMVKYIHYQHNHVGIHPNLFMFTHSNGRPVTKDTLNSVIKQAIATLGLPTKGYTTHSLRAGAATTASQAGLTDNQIKQLGHWSSNAFSTYIQPSITHLFTIAHKLTKSTI